LLTKARVSRSQFNWTGGLMFIVLMVFLMMALVGGGWGHSRYGYAGWSPAGLILVVLAVLYFTGHA
jgi:hypothetical protein